MTKPWRILHCLWHGEVGGAERAVYQLVRTQLQDSELAPAILFAQPGGCYWEWAQTLMCPVITLNLPSGHALPRLPAIVSAMRAFDIHHFHSGELLLFLASLMCPNARRVYTHRGGIIDYSFKKRVLHEALGVLLRFCFHGFSGNTAYGARCGAKLYHLPEEWFQVTYNGLEFDSLVPQRPSETLYAQHNLNPSHFVIGTAANLKPWKRIDLLLRAVVNLDNPNIKILIVGDGVDRARLETLTDELGLRSQVIFADRQPHVADYLQVMDVFCLPSMGLESFGNAAVEAMATGLPTIVFADGGGMVEHIRSEENGFIVANQSQLVETLGRLLAERELGKRIGRQARVDILERYTSSRSAAAYKSLYARAWSNNGFHTVRKLD